MLKLKGFAERAARGDRHLGLSGTPVSRAASGGIAEVPPHREPTSFRVLTRLFLRQFASFESISPSGEMTPAVVAVVSLLAAPCYLLAVITLRLHVRLVAACTGRFPGYEWLRAQEWSLLTVSLAAVTVLAAVQWNAFVLNGRDRAILGVLPVPRGTVNAARLASVMAIVLLLHLGLNFLPGLIVPLVTPLGFVRYALALQATLLLQTTFACAAIVAAHGVLGLVLPRRLVPRASALLQFALLLGAVLLVVSGVPRFASAVRNSSHLLNAVLPVVWFHALHVRLLGGDSAQLTAQALRALAATALAVAAAVPCCLAGFRDSAAEPATPGPARLGISRPRPAGSPIVVAVSSFVCRAVAASPVVGLIARGWFAVGLALTLTGFGALLLRQHGYDASTIPSAPFHAPAIVLPFFGLLGLRLAATVPASLEANWIFQLTEIPGSSDYAAGVRSAAMRRVVWPTLAALSLPYVALWGPLRALAHLALALGIARVTLEWLFFAFPKVPFTCTYLPGKAKLRVAWPKLAAIFLLYCVGLPSACQWLLSRPVAWSVAVALLLAGREVLVRAGRRRLAARGRLVFDERPAAFITRLELDG